jgi:NAD(P)-dependent dehydrogenase (short-subunit alcohol dehydrogenase family)
VKRHALVTGCSRGIGLAVREALLGDSWRVYGAARTAPALDHPEFSFAETDVAALASVERLRDAVEADLAGRPLDAVIHCAVVQSPVGPLEETDPNEWAKSIQIGLVGSYNVVRLMLPQLHGSRSGRILLFAGGGAFSPRARFSAYACAKAGVVRLAETLAEELKGTSVTVNCVAPGFVPTPIHETTLKAGRRLAGAEYDRVIRDVAYDDGSRLPRVVACIRHLLSPSTRSLRGETVAAQFDDWEHLTPFTVPEVMATEVWTARRVNEVPATQRAQSGSFQQSNRVACSRSSGPVWRAARRARGRRSRGDAAES